MLRRTFFFFFSFFLLSLKFCLIGYGCLREQFRQELWTSCHRLSVLLDWKNEIMVNFNMRSCLNVKSCEKPCDERNKLSVSLGEFQCENTVILLAGDSDLMTILLRKLFILYFFFQARDFKKVEMSVEII